MFTVRYETGSFPVAAAVVACFGVGTLAMPVQARLLDRHGQRRMLPLFGGAFTVVLGVAVGLAVADVRNVLPWLGIGVLLGPAAPALGTAMRAQWRSFTEGTTLKPRAYALDAACEDALSLGGPIVSSAVLVLAPPWVGLVLAAALVLTGTAGLASSPVGTAPVGGAGTRTRGGGRPGLGPLLGVIACVGLSGGASYTVVAALADALHHPEYAGFADVGIAIGAIAGGLLWGRRRHRRRWTIELPLLAAVSAAAVFAASAAPGIVGVGACLAFAAAATAPIFVVAYATADDLVPAERRTEAGSWLNAVSNTAFAVGTAAAGATVGLVGPASVLRAAAVGLAVASAAILVHQSNRIHR